MPQPGKVSGKDQVATLLTWNANGDFAQTFEETAPHYNPLCLFRLSL
jgi:hypothetical protein